VPDELRSLDAAQADVLEALCETFVPGSSRVRPVVYIDAVVTAMPPEVQGAVFAAIDALADAADGGAPALEAHAGTPHFGLIRALAVEAFYSDFRAPGAPGPTAYEEIDFHSPLAMRLAKDWSYMGIVG
jgi:hypothetical protein